MQRARGAIDEAKPMKRHAGFVDAKLACLGLERLAIGDQLLVRAMAVQPGRFREAEQLPRLSVQGTGGDIAARSLTPVDQTKADQFCDGAHHRATADAVFVAQFGFGGQAVAGLQLAVDDPCA